MKFSRFAQSPLGLTVKTPKLVSRPADYKCVFCQRIRPFPRRFTTSTRRFNGEPKQKDRGPFRSRFRAALRDTKVEWRPIPIGLGIAFLGAAQFYRVRQRENRRQKEEEEREKSEADLEKPGRPTRRKRVRPSGPW